MAAAVGTVRESTPCRWRQLRFDEREAWATQWSPPRHPAGQWPPTPAWRPAGCTTATPLRRAAEHPADAAESPGPTDRGRDRLQAFAATEPPRHPAASVH